MNCRIADLRSKDVVCVGDGSCLGCVGDVEIDTYTARLVAIIIYGRPKCFGMMGYEDDCVICWEDIKLIGEDAILVDTTALSLEESLSKLTALAKEKLFHE